jgi:AcrR family transcriptional regulator
MIEVATARRHRQKRGVKTEQKVLDVAERLLRNGGYDAAQVSHLVKESGVSVGSFYHHFGSKEGIIARLVQQFCDDGQAELEEIKLENPEFDSALQTLITTALGRIRANPELYRTLAARVDKEPEIWLPFRQLRSDFEAKALELLRDGLLDLGVKEPRHAVKQMMQVFLAVMTHTILFESGPITLNGANTDKAMLALARATLLAEQPDVS